MVHKVKKEKIHQLQDSLKNITSAEWDSHKKTIGKIIFNFSIVIITFFDLMVCNLCILEKKSAKIFYTNCMIEKRKGREFHLN